MGELPTPKTTSRKGEENGRKATEESEDDFKRSMSVSQIYEKDLRTKLPDKMVDILQGYLLIAHSGAIIYVNIKDYGIEDDKKIPKTVNG